MQKKRSLVLLTGLAAALALTGCQTYTSQTASTNAAVRSGNFESAVAQANKSAEKNKDSKDAILYRLEQGSILRSAAFADLAIPGQITPVAATPETATTTPQTATNIAEQAEAIDPVKQYLNESNEALDLAEEKVNKYEEEAKIKVGSTVGSTLTNQANYPYTGRAYDKVMMNTYKAINYLQLGDNDAARVELNRALQRQRDAVDANAKRIEAAQEEAQAAKDGKVETDGKKAGSYDVDKAKADPKTGTALAEVEAEFDSKILPYGAYVNPFAVYLDGLYFLNLGADGSDLERSRKSFERVKAFAPENPYIAADLEAASTAAAPANVTYIIFETGSAPYRDQIRIDIPTFLLTSNLSYVGAAFPRLKYVGDYARVLTVSDGVNTYTSALVSSMDSVVSQDFKNEWPSIVTKTLISTATKAILDAVIQNQAKQQFGFTGQLLAKVATAATQAAMNIADTRTWRSLPKEFQIVRLETPASRQLTIYAGLAPQTLTVEPGSVNVVYVKSTSSTSPLLVSQFALK